MFSDIQVFDIFNCALILNDLPAGGYGNVISSHEQYAQVFTLLTVFPIICKI